MDMIETMRRSTAVEMVLRNGHVVYGRFLGVAGKNFILCDSDGSVVFVPTAEENLAYVKVVSDDPEISRALDRMYGDRPSRRPVEPPPREQMGLEDQESMPPRRIDPTDQSLSNRVDVQPIIMSKPPTNRNAAIEEIKERHRHANSFGSSNQISPRPAFRPTIRNDEGDE